MAKRVFDEAPLDVAKQAVARRGEALLQGLAEAVERSRGVTIHGRGMLHGASGQGKAQMRRVNLSLRGGQQGKMNDIFKFPDVPRPRIALEGFQRIRRERRLRAIEPRAVNPNEMIGQCLNVATAIAAVSISADTTTPPTQGEATPIAVATTVGISDK